MLSCDLIVKNLIIKSRGFLIVFLSSMFVGLSQIYIKKCYIFSGSEQTFLRYLLTMICMSLIVYFKKVKLFGYKDIKSLLISRALFGIFALICLTFAVKLIDPSDAMGLYTTKIIVVVIVARIWLKEKMTISYIIALILMIVGVFLITKPSFLVELIRDYFGEAHLVNETSNETVSNVSIKNSILSPNFHTVFENVMGISIVLFGAIGAGYNQVLLKQLSNKKIDFSVMLWYVSAFGIPICIVISLLLMAVGLRKGALTEMQSLTRIQLSQQVFYSFLANSFGILAQVLFYMSLKYEDASKASVYKLMELIFVFVFQYLILSIIPDIFSITGATLIFIGALLVLVFKIIDAKHTKKMNSMTEMYLRKNLDNELPEEEEPKKKESLFKKIIFYKF
jgi:drug/metabolite transporter (DMT)-like permease